MNPIQIGEKKEKKELKKHKTKELNKNEKD